MVLVWLFLEKSESSGVGLGVANWVIKWLKKRIIV